MDKLIPIIMIIGCLLGMAYVVYKWWTDDE